MGRRCPPREREQAGLGSLAIYGRNPAWALDGERSSSDARRDRACGCRRITTMTAPRRRGDVQWSPWSPDGRRALYLSTLYVRRVNRAEVGTMSPDGTGKKRLYRGPCCVVGCPSGQATGQGWRFRPATIPQRKSSRNLRRRCRRTRLRSFTRVPAAELAWQPTQRRTQGRRDERARPTTAAYERRVTAPSFT